MDKIWNIIPTTAQSLGALLKPTRVIMQTH